jgi:PHD/YefM family antitoxin component YafN of YafNO toxin-antitoxin module
VNVSIDAIVSNSDIIKNYKTCRGKAEKLGRIFILKYNQPDAVLFSIKEYERFYMFIEYLEKLNSNDISKIYNNLPKIKAKLLTL